MTRSSPDLPVHLQRQLGLTSHCFHFGRPWSLCPFQTHIIVEFQGPHPNAMWQWTGWSLCSTNLCDSLFYLPSRVGQYLVLWEDEFVVSSFHKIPESAGSAGRSIRGTIVQGWDWSGYPACWPGILRTFGKPSVPLSILTYVKENGTYLTPPHRVLLRSNSLHLNWMSLKSSLLTIPSPRPRIVKLAPFGQSPEVESILVRSWGYV